MIVLGVLIVSMTVEIWLYIGLKDSLKSRKLTNLLSTEVGGLVENQTVAISQNVC